MAYPKRFGTSRGRKTVVGVVGAELHFRFGDVEINDLVAYLEDLGVAAEDMQPVFEAFGRYLVETHIPYQFRRKGYPKKWPALSPGYARWKQRHYPGRPLLVLSGEMKKGFKWETSPRTLKVVNRVTRGQKGKHAKTPRWLWHQHGTDVMPARQMVQMYPAVYDAFRAFVRDHLKRVEDGK